MRSLNLNIWKKNDFVNDDYLLAKHFYVPYS